MTIIAAYTGSFDPITRSPMHRMHGAVCRMHVAEEFRT